MVSPRSLPDLTDGLLEEIFLRLGSPADLARASTACVAFRRLIADPSFLRQHRSLHPPQILGLLDSRGGGFQPVEAPHPSAAAARAVASAGDFSFDDRFPSFTGCRWHIRDVQDGRVLIFRYVPREKEKNFFPDLAVCDPLARRCLLLPPIPDDLLAPVQVQLQNIRNSAAFLVPSGDEEDDTSFRVISCTNCIQMVAAFVFSSATGHWNAGIVSWDALSIPLTNRLLGWPWLSNYAYGCFYWNVWPNNKWILKFDMTSMEFSTIDLPPEHDGNCVIVGEAGEGRLGMFGLANNINNGAFLCYNYSIGQIRGKRFDQLKMDNIIPLPKGYFYQIHNIFEGHIFISGHNQPMGKEHTCFALEIKTLKIKRVCQMRSFDKFYPYFGFPPFMSPRRV